MIDFTSFGKAIIVLGLTLVFLGISIMAISKIPYLGKLPGDIFIKKGNFTLFFPLATSILVSIILTVILNFLFRR